MPGHAIESNVVNLQPWVELLDAFNQDIEGHTLTTSLRVEQLRIEPGINLESESENTARQSRHGKKQGRDQARVTMDAHQKSLSNQLFQNARHAGSVMLEVNGGRQQNRAWCRIGCNLVRWNGVPITTIGHIFNTSAENNRPAIDFDRVTGTQVEPCP